MNGTGILVRVVLSVLVAGLFAAFFILRLNRYLTLEAIHDNERVLRTATAQHPLLAPMIFVAVYALIVALSIPAAAVITMAGGFLFGLWLGGALAIVAATLGAVLVFLLARFVIGDTARNRTGPYVRRMAEGFKRNAFSYLLVLRLVPIFPFWAVNIVPALAGVRLPSFAVATLIGIIPGTLAYAAVGDSLGLYFAAGSGVPLSAVFTPGMIILRLGLALLALLPVLIQWLWKRRS
jgi:uncharacterized membrane protein YdjX (TVP38/TMEM64 family)